MSKIYTLGPDGSYSSKVAKNINTNIGYEIEYKSGNNNFEEIIEEVKKGFYGIVPIENCYGGIVEKPFELLLKNQDVIEVVGFTSLKIDHCLASKNGEENTYEIDKVFSHPQALKQCESFIKISGVETEETPSTISHKDSIKYGEGIICSKDSAVKYGMNILNDSVAPVDNITRFAFIKNKDIADEFDLSDIKNLQLDTYMCLIDEMNYLAPGVLNKLLKDFETNDFLLHFLKNENGENDLAMLFKTELENFGSKFGNKFVFTI